MCKFCDKTYCNIDKIDAYYCHDVVSIPHNTRACVLNIFDCGNLNSVSNIKDIEHINISICPKITNIKNNTSQTLYISSCFNLVTINNIKTHKLNIQNCPNIREIPYIEGLQSLTIYLCPRIIKIHHNQELKKLRIEQCKKLHNIYTTDQEEIKKYISALAIQRWLKQE